MMEKLAKGYKLGDLVASLRAERSIPRTVLARNANIPVRTIQSWEHGERLDPRLSYVIKVLDVMDLDIWIIDRKRGVLVERLKTDLV